VLGVAQLAGIMGAKHTALLVPLCHPIPIDGVNLELTLVSGKGVRIEAKVKTFWKTGVEMEALTAVTVAALTVYDMIKAIDRGAKMDGIRLLRKTGGKSGNWEKY
jgi:cyclic pyranopterin phosphate synthase